MKTAELTTFVAKSGNVALIEIKGACASSRVLEITWDEPPSKKDIREYNNWYAQSNPESTVVSHYVEDDDARGALIDSLLHGGTRN